MRRALAGLPLVFAIGLAWAEVGEPMGWRGALLATCVGAALLLLPARAGWWLVAVPAATLAVVVGTTAARPDRALARLVQGAQDAPTITAPFDVAGQPALAALAVTVSFLAIVSVAALVTAGRPLAAGVMAAVAIGWPATLTGLHVAAWASVAAAAALWPAVVSRSRGAGGWAVAGAAVAATLLLVAGAAASGVGPGQSHVDWRGWDPLGEGTRVSVGYVWDASYDGISFPRRPTELLRIEASPVARYWRVSTLDVFVADRWIENLYPVLVGPARRDLPADPLLPAEARDRSTWIEQTVTIESLDERRLVAAAQPVRVETRDLTTVFVLSGGVMVAPKGVDPRDRYTIWSYAPQPEPRALVDSPPVYPGVAGRYLDIGRSRFPAFGEADRTGRIEATFDPERNPDLAPYRALWTEARRLTAGTDSPYVATLAVERWLRTAGGYGYDESPPRAPAGVPPLVDFALRTRLGYCQHFAGTMALMLRTLGIPARVAVGFTSGRRADGEWVVTDHDAHAWVEAWFAGHGWLPFDPTPGRGTFATAYSYAADSADAVRALGTGRFLDFTPEAPSTGPTPEPTAEAVAAKPAPARPWWLAVVVVAPLVWVGALWARKHRRRRHRLGLADPRARADAIRRELADTLRDHGVATSRTAPARSVFRLLERELGVHAGQLHELVVAARYGPPAGAHDAADAAAGEVARVRAAVARNVGRWRTVRAVAHPGTARGR